MPMCTDFAALPNVFPCSGFQLYLRYNSLRITGLQSTAADPVSLRDNYSTSTSPFVMKIAKPGSSGRPHVINTSRIKIINDRNKDK